MVTWQWTQGQRKGRKKLELVAWTSASALPNYRKWFIAHGAAHIILHNLEVKLAQDEPVRARRESASDGVRCMARLV